MAEALIESAVRPQRLWLRTVLGLAAGLFAAGVNQINISMNYPDARQDQERGIPGLFERLESTVPKMVAEGSKPASNSCSDRGAARPRRSTYQPTRVPTAVSGS